MEYIRSNVLKSLLTNIFDLTKIKWETCDKDACGSLVFECAKMWDERYKIKEIAELLKISRTTVTEYLKKASKLNLCDYTIRTSNDKKVVCLNDNTTYANMKSAANSCGLLSPVSISDCINGKQKTAGKNKLGEPLHWAYSNSGSQIA